MAAPGDTAAAIVGAMFRKANDPQNPAGRRAVLVLGDRRLHLALDPDRATAPPLWALSNDRGVLEVVDIDRVFDFLRRATIKVVRS